MKKAIWLLILIPIVFLSSCDQRGSRARNVIVYGNDGSTEDVVLENQYLQLRFFPETTGIVITEKATGTQWNSNPAGDDPLADTVTKYLLQSLFALEYTDVSGVGQTLYSSEHSIFFGAFDYSIVDGALEVNYSVGNIERTYVIPPAIPEERMNHIFDIMDPGDVSIVKAGYRLYDIKNLRSSDNRSELLSLYPDLNRRNVYVLRSNTQEYLKAEYEQIFEGAGYTYDDYLDDVANYPSVGGRERPAFNVTLRYSLEGNSLIVNVPFDKIAYRGAYPMVKLAVLPYFGAGGTNDEGYLLVPDGSGALIYFNNGRQNQLSYNNDIYGWDEALYSQSDYQ